MERRIEVYLKSSSSPLPPPPPPSPHVTTYSIAINAQANARNASYLIAATYNYAIEDAVALCRQRRF